MRQIIDYNGFFASLFWNLLFLIGGTLLIAQVVDWRFALGLAFLFMFLKGGK